MGTWRACDLVIKRRVELQTRHLFVVTDTKVAPGN
jgi:hypothetical protein